MNPIQYHISIAELDARLLQAPKQEDETEEEFEQRLRESEGQNLFRILVQDGEAQQFQASSPYFDKTSEQQRWATLDQGLKQIKKAIVARERLKAKQPKKEKPALITDGVQQEMQRLNGRMRRN